jgi:DNA-binding transcriptional regulator YiaG
MTPSQINPFYAARIRNSYAGLDWTSKSGPTYAKLPRAPINASPVPHLTSLYHFDRAGQYGKRSYPGNCGGGLIRDLLLYFKPQSVFNPMTGSGTCRDVCNELATDCWSSDLHENCDACDATQFPRACFEFAWIHPPYWRQKLYCDDPRDLSRAPTLEAFLDRYRLLIENVAGALVPSGKLAILMGDSPIAKPVSFRSPTTRSNWRSPPDCGNAARTSSASATELRAAAKYIGRPLSPACTTCAWSLRSREAWRNYTQLQFMRLNALHLVATSLEQRPVAIIIIVSPSYASRDESMSTLAVALKDEIRRLARKEIRAQTGSTERTVAQHRREIAALKRKLREQEKLISVLATQKRHAAQMSAEDNGANGGVRFSARSAKAQRRRAGLSAADYARLVGVSPLTIYSWENGKSRPRKEQLASLFALRGLGKREALAKLKLLSPGAKRPTSKRPAKK